MSDPRDYLPDPGLIHPNVDWDKDSLLDYITRLERASGETILALFKALASIAALTEYPTDESLVLKGIRALSLEGLNTPGVAKLLEQYNALRETKTVVQVLDALEYSAR